MPDPDTGRDELEDLLARSPRARALIRKALFSAHARGQQIGKRKAQAEFDTILNRFHALKELNGTGKLFKATWEETKHPREHGKFSSSPGESGGSAPTGGGTEPPGDPSGSAKVRGLLARIASVPRTLRKKVTKFVSEKYADLQTKFGKTGARAILAASILMLPTPIPFGSMIPIALANAAWKIHHAVTGQSERKAVPPELSQEEIAEAARQFLAELYEHCGEELPHEVQGEQGEQGGSVTKAWDESKHPRGQPGNKGEFGSGGGATNVPEADEADTTKRAQAKENTPDFAAVATALVGNSTDLPEETRAKYALHLAAVLARMPDRCRTAALDAVGAGSATFHADFAAVKAACEKVTGRKEKGLVGGFVVHRVGDDRAHLHLDGGTEAEAAEGIYAHELGHAVDVGRRHSETPKWQSAWKAEVVNGRHLLSRYARTSATEGFAEFHRAICEADPVAVKAKFPRCFAFFQSQGLL